MPWANVNGVNTYYQQVGSGPDVVMVHGLAANLAFWYLKILPLLSSTFRVTVYDLRGHGYSEMPLSHYSSTDMAADLLSLLDVLGIEKANLVGHSFGGLVVLNCAILAPDRVATLVIADSRIHALQPVQKLKDWPYWKTWKTRLDKLGISLDEDQDIDYRVLASMAVPSIADRRQHSAKQNLRNPSSFIPFDTWNAGRRSAEHWLRLLNTTTAGEDFKAIDGITLDRIRQMHHSTRAIYGEYSLSLPSGYGLHANLPNCKISIVPRAGHFHPVVKPRIFIRELREFLPTSIR